MEKRNKLRILILYMFILPLGCTQSPKEGANQEKQSPLVVFLVRHAEKVEHSMEKDSELTEEGYDRANELARTLADAEIEYVHTTDLIRTRNTAAPVAALFGLELELYAKSDLYDLADKIEASGGRHLVVGHSNTTPALVEILGGEPGLPIVEENEYDRLYVLSIMNDEVNTVLLRYGKPCSSELNRISASSRLVPQTSGSALN